MKKIYQNVFLYGLNLSYILYFFVIIGFTSYAPEYLSNLNIFLKTYIGVLLLYFYNPITYKENRFGDFDRRLVFSAGIFLLFSTTLVSGIQEYIQNNGIKILINPNV